jgi:hypothetical protein
MHKFQYKFGELTSTSDSILKNFTFDFMLILLFQYIWGEKLAINQRDVITEGMILNHFLIEEQMKDFIFNVKYILRLHLSNIIILSFLKFLEVKVPLFTPKTRNFRMEMEEAILENV